MSRPVGSIKSMWIGRAPGFWGALTMMVALVFGVLLCSGIITAQTAPPPANENFADSQAINSAAAIPTYTIKDLGTLEGADNSFGTDLDDSGRVVGYAHNFTTGFTHAFLYSGGQMQDLGTLPGGTESFASGIAANSPVVGAATYDSTGDVFESGEHAFRYAGGQMQDLGTLPGDSRSRAEAINASGQIVGSSRSETDNPYTSHAFLYSGGQMQNLGTLDGGSISAAYDINDSGQVVGSSNGGTSSGQEHAFLYSGGQMQDLGTLGGAFSRASGINDAGQVVGAAGTPTGNRRAFLYSGGQMKDLGTLDGGSSSVANDINNSGQVVGWSTKSNAESNAYPFLYSDGQMHDLNSLIPAGSGWQLFSAEAINTSGQIVGRGWVPGASGQRAFIATPDTPTQEDTIDPEIAITTPPQGATYTVGQAVAASYSCTDSGSGVASCEGPVADGANIDTSSAGTKTFTVRATDNVGNTNSVSHTYTVNDATTTMAPTVISTVPQANATGVAPAVNVRATFSEAMDASTTDGDPSTINGKTFKLFKAGTTTGIRAVVGYDATAKKAILNPNANLKRGTKYKAVVTTEAQDLAGNRLDQNSSLRDSQSKQWVFTVRR